MPFKLNYDCHISCQPNDCLNNILQIKNAGAAYWNIVSLQMLTLLKYLCTYRWTMHQHEFNDIPPSIGFGFVLWLAISHIWINNLRIKKREVVRCESHNLQTFTLVQTLISRGSRSMLGFQFTSLFLTKWFQLT